MQSMVSDVISEGRWSLPAARGDDVARLWKEVADVELPPRIVPDRVVLTLNAYGMFSLKSAWHLIIFHHPHVVYADFVWHKYIIPRHSFITWFAMNGALSTMDKISAYRQDVSPLCVYCQTHIESVQHLFFESFFTSWIWTELLHLFHVDRGPLSLLQEIIDLKI